MRPHLNCGEGDIVYVRATVLEACSDFFKVRVEDFPNLVITAYVPVSEVAKAEDIHALRPMRREFAGERAKTSEMISVAEPCGSCAPVAALTF